MQELQPIGQTVIIEIVSRADLLADQAKKSSGILIPTEGIKQDEPNQGLVQAISKSIEDPGYKVGDMVIYGTKEVFQGFKFEGKKLISMQHSEIKAIITEEVA